VRCWRLGRCARRCDRPTCAALCVAAWSSSCLDPRPAQLPAGTAQPIPPGAPDQAPVRDALIRCILSKTSVLFKKPASKTLHGRYLNCCSRRPSYTSPSVSVISCVGSHPLGISLRVRARLRQQSVYFHGRSLPPRGQQIEISQLEWRRSTLACTRRVQDRWPASTGKRTLSMLLEAQGRLAALIYSPPA